MTAPNSKQILHSNPTNRQSNTYRSEKCKYRYQENCYNDSYSDEDEIDDAYEDYSYDGYNGYDND